MVCLLQVSAETDRLTVGNIERSVGSDQTLSEVRGKRVKIPPSLKDILKTFTCTVEITWLRKEEK